MKIKSFKRLKKVQSSINNVNLNVFYGASVLFAILYFFGLFWLQLKNVFAPGTGYFNFTNIMLCLLVICHAVFPISLFFGKKNLTKAALYIISALYMFGNVWFIRWIFTILFSGELSFDFAAYQLKWSYMFNHTLWASRNAETLLLNYLNSILWFNIAKNIDRDRKKTYLTFLASMFVSFILPIAFFYITRGRFIAEFWVQQSSILFLSYVALFFTMFFASQRKTLWNTYICVMSDKMPNKEKKQ